MLCIAYVLQRHIKGFSLPSHQMQSEECHRCTGPLGCCVEAKVVKIPIDYIMVELIEP